MSYASRNFRSSLRAHALFSSCKSVVCLLWAVGYISELPPYDQQADPELTNELPTEPAQILIKKAALRPQGSVENNATWPSFGIGAPALGNFKNQTTNSHFPAI
jgi:hypothetical protein